MEFCGGFIVKNIKEIDSIGKELELYDMKLKITTSSAIDIKIDSVLWISGYHKYAEYTNKTTGEKFGVDKLIAKQVKIKSRVFTKKKKTSNETKS